MADVEADLRGGLAEGAREFVVLLRRGLVPTPDLAVRQLADRAFGSVERLQDAAALLDTEGDGEAKALLVRAARLAANPSPAAPAIVRERPDASRYGGSGASAPAPGGVTVEGGANRGEKPARPS